MFEKTDLLTFWCVSWDFTPLCTKPKPSILAGQMKQH